MKNAIGLPNPADIGPTEASSTVSTVALLGCRIERALGGAVEIVEASRANRCFPVRVTESLGVCLKFGRAHHVRVDGRDVIYPEDAICVRPPGCIWSTTETGHVGFLSVDVEASLLPSGLVRGAGMRFADPGVLPDLPTLARTLRAGDSPELLAESVANLVLALGRANLITADELRESAPAGTSERVREALEHAVAEAPSLATLAGDHGVSRFALLRQFKRDFGVTPHAFTLSLRVERARERLARGADLATVALELGFADQPHFTRVFRNRVGIAPGEYARRVRRTVSVS